MTPSYPDFRRCRGFTLIELLVVIGIVALMLGLAVSYVGDTFNVRVKQESVHLVALIQTLYNEAAMKGIPHRLVFDLSEQQYWAESSTEESTIRSAESAQKELDQKKESAKSNEEPAALPSFLPLEDSSIKRKKLDDIVRIRDIYVSHQEGLITDGMAYLYFFPTGVTERAIIHLSDESEESSFSIIVNPMTGRSKVQAEYVEYESLDET